MRTPFNPAGTTRFVRSARRRRGSRARAIRPDRPCGEERSATSFATDLRLHGGPRELTLARHRLRSWLVDVGVGAPHLDQALSAAGEACANAFEHSGAASRTEPFSGWMRALITGEQLTIFVGDAGRWKAPPPTVLGQPQPRGRGLMWMEELADSVQVRKGSNGTVVHLVVRMHSLEIQPDASDAR